jgi:hypothetical protein
MNPSLILLINLISTWYMVGLIWFVQLVHYPLMAEVHQENFSRYEKLHTQWTTWAVGPPMLIEAFTAVMLLYWTPAKVDLKLALVAMFLVLAIWLLTAICSVPMHARLEQGFDSGAHRWLVNSNWFRTFLWTARGGLVALMAWKAMGS